MRNTRATQLLFELSKPGRRAMRIPASDVPDVPLDELLPASCRAAAPPPLPELTEPDLVRHFANLSTQNMSVDTHFYPLGSCTMKYNPKRNERAACAARHGRLASLSARGIAARHVAASVRDAADSDRNLGLDAASLQPAAGAQGELTALMVAAAYFRDQGQRRTKVLAPDSAHGTNPASAAMAGFDAVTVKSNAAGPRRSRKTCTRSSTTKSPCS